MKAFYNVLKAMSSFSRKFVTWLAFTPALLSAQRVTILAPAGPVSHVDLVVRDTLRLVAAVDGVTVAASWKSGGTAASVTTRGLVTAKQRGYTTITATYVGQSASVRACVTDSASVVFTVAIDKVSPVLHSPIERGAAYRAGLVTHWKPVSPSGYSLWGSCVHWWIEAGDVTNAKLADGWLALGESRGAYTVRAGAGPGTHRP